MQHRVRDDTGLFAHSDLDRIPHIRVIAQELLGVFAALTDSLAGITEPGAGFFHHAGLDAEIDQFAGVADALTIHDVELDLTERRRHLDLAGAANFQAHRGIEFKRVAAGRRFRVAEHHADLHADLVEEDQDALTFGYAAGDLAQLLTHEPSVQTHVAVAHFAFQFGARHQSGDAVHHQ